MRGGARAAALLLAVASCTGAVPSAFAHLMVAQHGTLNVVDNGVFMVLSLPSAAFAGMDTDGDGALSSAELATHRDALGAAVTNGVTLHDQRGELPLRDVMLTPAFSHGTPDAPVSQLIVTGRFVPEPDSRELRLQVDLYGPTALEQELEVSVRRPLDERERTFRLSPDAASAALFPVDAGRE